jgi:hypothetical protein
LPDSPAAELSFAPPLPGTLFVQPTRATVTAIKTDSMEQDHFFPIS